MSRLKGSVYRIHSPSISVSSIPKLYVTPCSWSFTVLPRSYPNYLRFWISSLYGQHCSMLTALFLIFALFPSIYLLEASSGARLTC